MPFGGRGRGWGRGDSGLTKQTYEEASLYMDNDLNDTEQIPLEAPNHTVVEDGIEHSRMKKKLYFSDLMVEDKEETVTNNSEKRGMEGVPPPPLPYISHE